MDLYQYGIRLDTAFSDTDGTFKFPRQFSNRRYEIHIQLGPDTEFQEEVDFQPGIPTMVQLNNPRYIKYTGKNANGPSSTMVSLSTLAAPK